MKNFYSRSFLLAALALPVLAQETTTKPVATTAAAGPVLVLKTNQMQLAMMLAMSFEHMEDMPELADGSHYVVSLGADRKIAVATATGDVGMVDVTADPGALMDLFAEQVEQAKPMVRGTMTLALQSQGMKPKDIADLVDGIFAFPKQMAQLRLQVVGDPENPKEKGIDVTLGMEPKAGAAFAGFVEGMKPSAAGVPALPMGKPAIAMQMSLEPASLAKAFAPFRDLAIGMTNQGAEQQAKALAMYDEMITLFDGAFAMAVDGKFQGGMLMGFQDAAKVEQLMGSEAYLDMMKGQQLANRDMEMEITPNAFEHRGKKVMKSKVSGEPNPMMPKGTMESFAAAIGNYMAISLGGGEGDAKSLFDAVADDKVKRAPIAGGAVMRVQVDMRAIVAIAQEQMGGGEIDEEMPEGMTMTLGKAGKSLQFQLHIQ